MTTQDYFAKAADWDYDANIGRRRRERLAWMLVVASWSVTLLSVLALVLAMPLKEFAPYVITVDRSTGWMEITRGLEPGDLTEDEAITKANIFRYVVARETYDAADVQENFDHVIRASAPAVAENHEDFYSRGNPNNPVNIYGYDGQITVQIKNVSFLNERTASVRFQTTTIERDRETVDHWIAILQFRYVSRPMTYLERLTNPLGFEVTSYRKDQEAVTP